MKRHLIWLVVLFGLTPVIGCGALDGGPELGFDYLESSHGTVVTPSIDAASLAASVIVFVGQLNTPKPCYRLVADLDVDGSQVTITVQARENQVATCEVILGRFIYEGDVRRLKPGTYQVKIIHRFDKADWPAQEFTSSVNVR